MTQALTDGDGRVRDLLERPLVAGDYRLEFDIGREDDAFFRRVAVDLRVVDATPELPRPAPARPVLDDDVPGQLSGRRATLDALPEVEFVAAVGPWFEGAPRFLARLAAARPFGDEATLFRRAGELARGHARTRAARADRRPSPPGRAAGARLERASFREQGYDRESTAAIADLERLNAAYEERFGFRFCIFVNGRSRAELVPLLEAALLADRAAEIRRALADVVAIARDRSAQAVIEPAEVRP